MPRALIFEVGGQRLALPEGAGRCEVLERGPVVPLPHGAPLLGLTALHGRAVPLLDLAALLDLPAPSGFLTLLLDQAGEALAWPVGGVEGLRDLPVPTGASAGPDAPRTLDLAALLGQVRSALQPQ